jgi:release factor glutamine methyltransferase
MWVVSGRSLWQWRREAIARAAAAGIEQAELDWLLQSVTTLDSLSLRLETFQDWEVVEVQRSLPDLTTLWQQRLEQHVPVQYLVGKAHWRTFTLSVSPAVLIPRPETELLIDLAAKQALATEQIGTTHWADLGTGSGAIALGLATVFPNACIHAVDCSPSALAIAQTNAQAHHLQHAIRFYQGDWFAPLHHLVGHLDGMVANPPYIPSTMILELQPEVAHHEPHLALDGGADGLDYIRHLVASAPRFLKPGGMWLVETMAGQAADVVALLEAQGDYCTIQAHADLAGIDRFVLATRR